MVAPQDLGNDVLALGELLGILAPDGANSAKVDTAWFSGAVTSMDQIGSRLRYLVQIIDSILGPPLADPPRLQLAPGDPASTSTPGLNWYPIPNPSTGGTTPFCLVASPPFEPSGQIGLGVDHRISLGALTIQAYVYVPLFSYGPTSSQSPHGATFIADSQSHPSQLGIDATTSESFRVTKNSSAVTFNAVSIGAAIYLANKNPTFG